MLRGFELYDSAMVCAWWTGGQHDRVIVFDSAKEREVIFDRVLKLLPGGVHSREAVRASLGCLVDCGGCVAVKGASGSHWVGLTRPHALGHLDGSLTLTATIRKPGDLWLPLLTADDLILEAFERSIGARDGGPVVRRRFTVEMGQRELFMSAALGQSRTELEQLLAADLGYTRDQPSADYEAA